MSTHLLGEDVLHVSLHLAEFGLVLALLGVHEHHGVATVGARLEVAVLRDAAQLGRAVVLIVLTVRHLSQVLEGGWGGGGGGCEMGPLHL